MPIDTLPRPITIRYRRLPNDIRDFSGTLREATSLRLVIEHPILSSRAKRLFGKVVVNKGYLAIWFIFKSKWYDVGKFYDRKRRWVGYYCDIVKPATKLLSEPTKTMTITDLFLDLWITPQGDCVVLDEDELEIALKRHIISASLARQAKKQMDSLIKMVRTGRFPPMLVKKVKPLNRA